MAIFENATRLSSPKPWTEMLRSALANLRPGSRKAGKEVTVSSAPIAVPEIWSRGSALMPRLLSLALHLTLLFLALIPLAAPPVRLPVGAVIVDVAPDRLRMPVSRNSGGGGRRDTRRASHGRLPRAADRQLVPPAPEVPLNLDPTLIAELTISAPDLKTLRELTLLQIGDPNGDPGPPSGGKGSGGGIGNSGIGTGVGDDFGPGAEGPFVRFRPGEGMTTPVLLKEVLPEYSEEARRARYQGVVVLDTVVREDGSVQVLRISHSLGFGLDEKAIAAVLQWRFQPARRNGRPVAVALNVEVSFNLR